MSTSVERKERVIYSADTTRLPLYNEELYTLYKQHTRISKAYLAFKDRVYKQPYTKGLSKQDIIATVKKAKHVKMHSSCRDADALTFLPGRSNGMMSEDSLQHHLMGRSACVDDFTPVEEMAIRSIMKCRAQTGARRMVLTAPSGSGKSNLASKMSGFVDLDTIITWPQNHNWWKCAKKRAAVERNNEDTILRWTDGQADGAIGLYTPLGHMSCFVIEVRLPVHVLAGKLATREINGAQPDIFHAGIYYHAPRFIHPTYDSWAAAIIEGVPCASGKPYSGDVYHIRNSRWAMTFQVVTGRFLARLSCGLLTNRMLQAGLCDVEYATRFGIRDAICELEMYFAHKCERVTDLVININEAMEFYHDADPYGLMARTERHGPYSKIIHAVYNCASYRFTLIYDIIERLLGNYPDQMCIDVAEALITCAVSYGADVNLPGVYSNYFESIHVEEVD
jgi:hypothetical protein